jgi:hypothetical protein
VSESEAVWPVVSVVWVWALFVHVQLLVWFKVRVKKSLSFTGLLNFADCPLLNEDVCSSEADFPWVDVVSYLRENASVTGCPPIGGGT